MSSPNPFGGANPFADPAVTAHTESGAGEDNTSYDVAPASTGAWGSTGGGWGSTGRSTNGRKLTATEMELSFREEEIKQREKQLEKRQQELEHLQRSTVTGTPAPVKNWPPCSPILYHDIDAEIPVDLQSTVRRAYQAYLVFCFTVLYNFLCLTLSLVHKGKIIAWLFAGIYAVTGIPGAFVLWYGRIYNAASYDRSVTFMCFFFGCAIHIGFCIWAAIPVPLSVGSKESSFAGFIEMFDKFDAATWIGVFYLLGFVLWVANAVIGVFVWQKAMRAFRGKGGPQQLQSEASHAAGRAILSSAAGGRSSGRV